MEETKKNKIECVRICHRLKVHGAPDKLPIAYIAAPPNKSYGVCNTILYDNTDSIPGSETLAAVSYQEKDNCTIFALVTSEVEAVVLFELVQASYRYHYGKGMTGFYHSYSAKIVLPGKHDKLFSSEGERSETS